MRAAMQQVNIPKWERTANEKIKTELIIITNIFCVLPPIV